MATAFFQGDGEMSELTRSKNWSTNLLGPPENWPPALKISLNILLTSKFPMFLWWGPELICFYNDAYRPSLGKEGKHPSILGMRGEEAWPEIWQVIKPLIDQVMDKGESVWFEDLLVPIFRNGSVENVYWTFSYSPIYGDTNKVDGVLVTCTETTDKVLVKRQLEESERKLRLSILQAPVSIGIFRGPDYITEIANARALRLWGRKEEEVLHRPILEAMPELQAQGIKQLLDKVYQTGNKFSAAELPVQILRDGQLEMSYVNFSYEPLYDEQGKIDGLMAIGVDVTQQVLGHKVVEKNEEKLKIVIEASELGTFELNLKTDAVECSERLYEIFGYPRGEKLSHNLFIEHLHPDDICMHRESFNQAYKSGLLHYEARIILNDKSIRWIEVKGKVFYDDHAQPHFLVGTLSDVTQSKLQQQVLFESEQKFRLLADSMPQHIWTSDTNGNLNYFNKSVYDYSGFSPEHLLNDGWLEIIHPDDRQENISVWINSITTGTDFLFEHRFRRWDGVYRWQLSRAIPQRDREGNIQMWVGTSTDIEDQKSFSFELEKLVAERTKKLAESNIELEKMNKELQSFAYISSHDLQEPLRKIQTFSSQIIEKEMKNLSDSGRQKFERMQLSAQRMQSLIHDLLTYSKTNTSERKFELADLHKITDEVIDDLKEEIRAKNAIIENGLSCHAKIIPFQFRQLLHNLMSNALKFSKPQQRPHIKIESETASGKELDENLTPAITYCHISITDNGIGFEPQYSKKIFEVFQRLHSNDTYNGTGIGLAIVKKIVENHQGFIAAKSKLNEGATFDIYLPM